EKAEEYRTFLVRKLALDEYTAKVASGGNQEQLEALKAELLAGMMISVEVNLEQEMGADETYLLPAPEAAPAASAEPEPVVVAASVPTYAQVVARVEREVEHLSLDQLLAVSLFGAELPEQEARAPKPRTPKPRKKSMGPKHPQSAASPVVQLELLAPIPFPVKTTAEQKATARQKAAAQSSWLDMVDEDEQREAA
ncbi:MAG TPA: hypothetical protein VFV38_07910, partial [Ktedonobacteraceae bacterium]|nr:hypothetical protein [Ktedonobacteraceae bacterium]